MSFGIILIANVKSWAKRIQHRLSISLSPFAFNSNAVVPTRTVARQEELYTETSMHGFAVISLNCPEPQTSSEFPSCRIMRAVSNPDN